MRTGTSWLRRRRWPHRGLIAAVLAASLTAAVVEPSPARGGVALPAPPAMPDAPAAKGVHPITPRPQTKPADAAARSAAPARVTWPTGAAVQVAAAAGGPEPAFDVSVADHAAGVSAGIDGAVFTITPHYQSYASSAAAAKPVSTAAANTTAASTSQASRAQVTLDYSGFANAFGGDYGSRLRLVQLPACALTTPQLAACRTHTPVPGAQNSTAAHTLSALMPTDSAAVLAAATDGSSAGSGGAAGTYGATSLKPSGTWSAGGSTGSFTYHYPIQVPEAASALVPTVQLSYDSGSVDGQTAATDAQAGWAGDGWSTPESFIEQSFVSCSDSPEGTASPKSTADMCYDGPLLTLSLNGSSIPLLWDAASSTFKASDDNGEVVKHITGADNGSGTYNTDYWQVTDRTGTVFQFGRNQLPGWAAGKPATNSVDTEPVFSAHSGDPCYKSSGFADSVCTMAYRWNLDYVKDPHGNAMAYYYAQDTNAYAENADTSGTTTPKATAPYVRESHLDHIDYGFTDGGAYSVNGGHAPDQVVFTTGDRCLSGTCDPLTKTNAANWPDVPYDLHCDLNQDCLVTAPSHWSTVRLAGIATRQWNGSAYAPVDSWALTSTLPPTGDGTSPTLWLSAITHTGSDTTAGGPAVTLPSVDFTAVALANRVDVSTLPPLTRMRISSITTETGEQIGVNYTRTSPCTAPVTLNPATNTFSCYPVYWTPQDNTQQLKDWFNKYQVDSVTQSDHTGDAPDVKTSYKYLGGGAWHFDDNELVKTKYRTYGQWRGFGDVQTFTGQGTDARTEAEATYYRGMSHDDNTTVVNLTDSQGGVHEDLAQLAGKPLETTAYNFEGGPVVGSTIASYWVSPATATRTRTGLDSLTANAVEQVEAWSRSALTDPATGAVTWRESETDTSYDTTATSPTFGMPLLVFAHGDLSDPTQQRCTATAYAPANAALNLSGLPAEIETDAKPCAGANPGGASVPGSGQINALAPPTGLNRQTDVVSDQRTVYDSATRATTWPQPVNPAWPQATPVSGDISVLQRASGYDTASGKLTFQTVSTSTYDGAGRGVDSYDALGNRTHTDYTLADGLIVGTRTTDPAGHVTSVAVDPLRGLPTTTTDENGVSSTFHYDGLGRMIAAWGAGRQPTQAATALFSYQVSRTSPVAVTSQTMNDAQGYATSTTLYDALLRPRQVQKPTPRGGRLVSDTFYDSRGWAWKSNNGWWDPATTPDTTTAGVPDSQVPDQTVTAFDGLGRAIVATSYSDSAVKKRTATQYGLTGPGGTERTISVPLDASGAALTGTTATSSLSDAMGRSVELDQYTSAPTVSITTTSGVAPITSVAVSGGSTLTSDGKTQGTRYLYDALGRQTDVVSLPTGQDWKSVYDLAGRVISKTDPDAGTSTSVYDAADRVVQATDARGKTVSTVYDALGRKSAEYAAPVSGQAPANQLASWVYDNADGAIKTANPYAVGHATTVTSYSGGSGAGGSAYTVQSLGFTAFGESLGESITVPAGEGALAGTYSYTNRYSPNTGLLLQNSYPASPGGGSLPAETVTHGYSGALDLPVSLSSGLSGYYAMNTSYTAFAQIGQEQIGTSTSNAAYITNSYDPFSNALTDSAMKTGGGAAVDEMSYTYDTAGNPTSETDKRQGTATDTQCFAYDALDRLKQAWTATDSCAADPAANHGSTVGSGVPGAAYWTSWTLDPMGQRTSQVAHGLGGAADTVTGYTYDGAGGHQAHTLTSTTTTGPGGTAGTAYRYDQAGNTVSRTTAAQGQQSLTWSDDGDLSSVTGPNGTSSYVYDSEGQLLLQRDPGSTTLYLPNQQLSLNTATGAVTGTRFIALPGGGTVVRTGGGTSYAFETADRQGTSLMSVDPTFTQAAWRQQTPYGAPRGSAPVSWPDNHGFLGKPTDTATGLTDVGARWYDPDTGRFASVDPVLETADSQQLNGYTYTGANPVSFSDPTGLTQGPPGSWCGDPSCWPTAHNPGEAYQQNGGNLTSSWNSPGWQRYNPNRNDHSWWAQQAWAQAAANAARAAAAAAAAKRSAIQSIVSRLATIAKDFIKILSDELGITAGLECLTQGAVGACVETAANILMSAVGGIIGKVLSKYGAPWKWAKAVRLGKKLWGLVHDSISLIKGIFKAEKAAKDAEEVAKGAEEVAKVASCSSNLCVQNLHWNEEKCMCTPSKMVWGPKLGEISPPVGTTPRVGMPSDGLAQGQGDRIWNAWRNTPKSGLKGKLGWAADKALEAANGLNTPWPSAPADWEPPTNELPPGR